MKPKDLFYKKAQEVLDLCGQKDAIPVDLKKILQFFNVSANPMNFDNLSVTIKNPNSTETINILGAMVANNDNVAIFYSDKSIEDSHRYRFTIAHELAHCCLHANLSHVELRTDSEFPSEEEKKVNIFAGELLIPEESLRKTIKELVVPTIHTLADIFQVSDNVMEARLKHLDMLNQVI